MSVSADSVSKFVMSWTWQACMAAMYIAKQAKLFLLFISDVYANLYGCTPRRSNLKQESTFIAYILIEESLQAEMFAHSTHFQASLFL